jgi:hypothetical protein
MDVFAEAISEMQVLKSDIRFMSKEFTEEFLKQIEIQSGSKSLAKVFKIILEK